MQCAQRVYTHECHLPTSIWPGVSMGAPGGGHQPNRDVRTLGAVEAEVGKQRCTFISHKKMVWRLWAFWGRASSPHLTALLRAYGSCQNRRPSVLRSCASLLTAVTALAVVGSAVGAVSGSPPLALTVLPQEFANAYGAACLDGSPPAFYSLVQDPTKWVLFIEVRGP